MSSDTDICLRVADMEIPGLAPLSFVLGEGECVAVKGRSGSGKTRLMRAIADLDAHQGKAWLDGERRSAIAPPLWRRQVMYFPAESQWWCDTVAPHAAHWNRELLARLGFAAEILERAVVHLSSGEKQRLALLRGLSRRPKVLLLDEPTANLDVDNAAAVEQLLQTMQEREGLCMLWTTHHDLQRDRVAKRTLSIESGDWVEEYRA